MTYDEEQAEEAARRVERAKTEIYVNIVTSLRELSGDQKPCQSEEAIRQFRLREDT